MWKKRKLLYLLNRELRLAAVHGDSVGAGHIIREFGIDSTAFMLSWIHFRHWYWPLMLLTGSTSSKNWKDPSDFDDRQAEYIKLVNELKPEYLTTVSMGANGRISVLGAFTTAIAFFAYLKSSK